MKKNTFLMLLLALSLCTACSSPVAQATSNGAAEVARAQETTAEADTPSDDEETAHPEGWTEETHSKSAEPNYEVVFPQDEVNRLDITITPENWQAMMEDMTALYGESGEQNDPGDRGMQPGRPGGQMPPDGEERPEGNFAPPDGQEMPEGNVAPPNDQAGQAAPPDGQERPEGDVAPPDGDVPMGRRQGGGQGMPEDSDVNPIYVPVTIDFEDNTWTNVGLRFKGNSSLRSTWQQGIMKLPLRLDFDQFEDEYPEIDNQRFYGFKQLALSSNFSDESFLREKVTADIFREAGVPASNTAFYEVYIDYGEDPIYFGLYTLTEIVEDTVIEEQFEDDSGNVYKPSGTGATFAEGTFSESAFDKQTNEEEADWSDIQALFDALHTETRTTDPETWRSELEAVFDVEDFLNWLAINSVVQNWDTYGSMNHNYYLYHDPTTDQLTWIPWDNNEALSADSGKRTVLSLDQENIGDNWPLIRYLMDDEVYHAKYVAYVEAVIEGAFAPEKMEETYQTLADLVAPYALSETEGYTFLKSGDAFTTAIETLIEHAYSRYETAATYVAEQP